MKYLLLPVFTAIMAAQDSQPDAVQLIHRALATAGAQADKGWQYTSREDTDEWDLDGHGNRVHQVHSTYEHIMLEGGDYKKLIRLNGKPLNRKMRAKVDAEEDAERAARKEHPTALGFHYGGSLDQLERLFNNKVTGAETVAGRATWRMESEPKANYRPASGAEEQLLAMRHVFWFDRQDAMEVKERGIAIRSSNGLPAGSTIEIVFAKFGDAWLIDMVTFATNSGGSHSQSSDYRRFAVDSRITVP